MPKDDEAAREMTPFRQLRAVSRQVLLLLLRVDLTRARLLDDSAAMAEDMLEIGRLRGERAEHQAAKRSFADADEIARRLGDHYLTSRTAVQLAASSIVDKDFEGARPLLERALPGLRERRDTKFLIDALLKLAFVYNNLERFADAMVCFDEVMALAKSTGDHRSLMRALDDMGGIAYRERKYADAERYWLQGLDLSRKIRAGIYQAKYSFFLALARMEQGDSEDVGTLLRESSQLYKRFGRNDLAARSERLLDREH